MSFKTNSLKLQNAHTFRVYKPHVRQSLRIAKVPSFFRQNLRHNLDDRQNWELQISFKEFGNEECLLRKHKNKIYIERLVTKYLNLSF